MPASGPSGSGLADDSPVSELTEDSEFEEAWSVMGELRTNLDEDGYKKLLTRMRPQGYRLFAGRVDGDIVALAGIGLGVNFYYGRYLWVYDLITTETARSQGHGKAMLEHLEELAREHRCHTVALSSALQRADAHRFYEEKAGYDRVSYTFVKQLR